MVEAFADDYWEGKRVKKREAQIIFDKLDMEIRRTHHLIGWFVFEGKKILKTRISFGKGDIPGSIADKFRGQLKLNETEFKALIDCSLSKDEYIRILMKKGFITGN